MESDTLPSASLVTLPRSDRSPRATWLITERRSVMLRCRDSFAFLVLFSLNTRATARFRFSAIYPSSSSVETSARDFESPAANRSENSARCCTGERNELLNRQPTNTVPASARNSASSTEPVVPLGKDPKSSREAPPDCRPALYASPSTANRTTLFRITSVHIVELSRDFIAFLQNVFWMAPSERTPFQQNLYSRSRKNFQQTRQAQNQCQAIVMPQHAHAMRHIFWRLLEQILCIHRIRSDYFVRSNAQSHIFVPPIPTHRSHHHVLANQAGSAAFGHRDINQRNNRPAQIKNAQQIRRT